MNWILGKKSSLFFFPGFSCSACVGSSLRCTLDRGSQAMGGWEFLEFLVLWICCAGSIVIHASLLHLFHSMVKINETFLDNELWPWRFCKPFVSVKKVMFLPEAALAYAVPCAVSSSAFCIKL